MQFQKSRLQAYKEESEDLAEIDTYTTASATYQGFISTLLKQELIEVRFLDQLKNEYGTMLSYDKNEKLFTGLPIAISNKR